MRRDEITVLIPAAGPVPEGIVAVGNVSSPAMIPVAGRPVIYWTLRYLRSLGLSRFVIAVAQRGTFVEDFVRCTFGREAEVEFFTPSKDGGVGRTVLELLERARTRSSLVVLGDTHFGFEDPAVLDAGRSFVLTSLVDDPARWCVAEVDGGEVRALHDKRKDLAGPLPALIGVYGLADTAEALRAARTAVGANEAAGKSRTELSAILRQLALAAYPAKDWLDVGNPDRQASSHRALLEKRAFNELSIDPVFGTITKRSRHVEKFIDEINYLRLLPPELAVLFPRVLDFSTAWDDPWVKLEYYGYPTLAEVFLFENVDPAAWEGVLSHLFEIVSRGFMRHARPLPKGALRAMYIDKTRARLAATTGSEALLGLIRHEGEIELNGRSVRNLPALWPEIEARVLAMEERAVGGIVHGDLCLSNILYDLRSRIVKLIDPRGSFGTAGIHGHPLYDVAKLYHSIYGLYDFIVADIFEVAAEGPHITLDLRSRPQHEAICARFERVFFERFDRREVLLVTGLLFASMPALHYDAPRRQLAMYARALDLLDEALA